VAGTLGVFLIETDRTLVDSHCTLLNLDRDDCFLASHLSLLEPVYVGFSWPRTTNLGGRAALSKIAISCRE
jgi:hypothetical protein